MVKFLTNFTTLVLIYLDMIIALIIRYTRKSISIRIWISVPEFLIGMGTGKPTAERILARETPEDHLFVNRNGVSIICEI